MEENNYTPGRVIMDNVPFYQDVLRQRSSCEGMKKILDSVPPDSDAFKEWSAFCDELEAMYQRGWALIQKHGHYIEECNQPSLEDIQQMRQRVSERINNVDLLLGNGWVIKKPSGERVGKPDLHQQTVFKALEEAGPGAYAEPADWESNESDVQIYAPPTEQERDMLGADEPLKDHLVFRVEKQEREF